MIERPSSTVGLRARFVAVGAMCSLGGRRCPTLLRVLGVHSLSALVATFVYGWVSWSGSKAGGAPRSLARPVPYL